MGPTLEASRSGAPTAKIKDISLHSSYDPLKEAERFLETSLRGRQPAAFITLGACLDYLGAAIQERFPEALLLRVEHDAWFASRGSRPNAAMWDPSSPLSLAEFLSAHLDESSSTGLQILEWPPASRAYPEAAARASQEVKRSLERLSASAATLKSYGRRWIANACRSFLLAPPPSRLEQGAAPVVVAAAGPTLAEALALLKPHRSGFFLIAVSSALAACRAHGLEPDLVVSTDGGAWSRWHLYPLAGSPLAIASPLVSLPSGGLLSACPLLLLEQGNFPETDLSALLGGAVCLPSHGTVSGTALQLAGLATTGPIIAAGLDLAGRDVVSHAGPHGFDALHWRSETRLSPLESSIWSRESALSPIRLSSPPWRASRSLAVYADSISGDAASPRFAGRLFRLLPSPVDLRGFTTLTAALGPFLATHAGNLPRLSQSQVEPCADRAGTLRARLGAWRQAALAACAGLSSGLPCRDRGTREMLMAIDFPDFAAAERALATRADATLSAQALLDSSLSFLAAIERKLLDG